MGGASGDGKKFEAFYQAWTYWLLQRSFGKADDFALTVRSFIRKDSALQSWMR